MKELQKKLVASAICIVAALAVACSKDDPGNETGAALDSFEYEYFSPKEPDYDFLRKWVAVDYSADNGFMSVRLDYADEYDLGHLRGFAIEENDVISLGYSVPEVHALPDCVPRTSMTWTLYVKGHGKRSIEIYNLGYNNHLPVGTQFMKGRMLTTIEVDLDKDFSKIFEITEYDLKDAL